MASKRSALILLATLSLLASGSSARADATGVSDMAAMLRSGRSPLEIARAVGGARRLSTAQLEEMRARNFDVAERFTALASSRPDSLDDIVRVARRADEIALGATIPERTSTYRSKNLDEALRALAVAEGVVLPAHALPVAITKVPAAATAALKDTIDAFTALARATRAAYARAHVPPVFAEMARLQRMYGSLGSVVNTDRFARFAQLHPEAFPAVDVDLVKIATARAAFLREVARVRTDLRIRGLAAPQDPIVIPPLLAVDLAGADSVYKAGEPAALTIDVGGNDTYLNNAGGNNLALDVTGCWLAATDRKVTAAALVDLGGNDQYGQLSIAAPDDDTAHAGVCGVNGGGAWGTGLIMDAAGDDRYIGASSTNKEGSSYGSNGGGFYGAGAIIDVAGNDEYTGGRFGSNGGSARLSGAIVDGGGSDVYTAAGYGSNGGGWQASSGYIVDLGDASDRYVAGGPYATNGSAWGGGAAALVDAGGDDRYVGGSFGTNGGAIAAQSVLIDLAGDDVYTADNWGVNGGGVTGVGLLFDAAGRDLYRAKSFGVNGGGWGGAGFLIDANGNDSFICGSGGANGGGAYQGTGTLIDLQGNDSFLAGSVGANGGGSLIGGGGLLADAGGNDTYVAGNKGANGGGDDGTGLLVDLNGTDSYQDALGSGNDVTVAPKGTVGAQVDL